MGPAKELAHVITHDVILIMIPRAERRVGKGKRGDDTLI